MYKLLFGSNRTPWVARGRFVDVGSDSLAGVRCSGVWAGLPTTRQLGIFFDADQDGNFEITHDGESFDVADNKHYWLRCSKPWFVVPNRTEGKSYFGTKFRETDKVVEGIVQREVGEVPVIDQRFAKRLTECATAIANEIAKYENRIENKRLFIAKRRRRASGNYDARIKMFFEKAKRNGGVLVDALDLHLPSDLFFQLNGEFARNFIENGVSSDDPEISVS